MIEAQQEVAVPTVPQDLAVAQKAGLVRVPTHIVSVSALHAYHSILQNSSNEREGRSRAGAYAHRLCERLTLLLLPLADLNELEKTRPRARMHDTHAHCVCECLTLIPPPFAWLNRRDRLGDNKCFGSRKA